MDKIIVAVFLACIFLHNPSQIGAQLIYQDIPPLTPVTELQNMFSKADSIRVAYEKVGFTHGRMDMLEINQRVFLFPDGHFDTFTWEGGKWRNLYKGIYYGYNHGAKKMIHDGIIYSYGGSGFWHSHGDVIWFNVDKGEWELVLSSGDLREGPAYTNNEKLYVFGSDCYEVNLETKKITMLHNCPTFTSLDKHNNTGTLEMKSYVLQLEHKHVYDKKTRSLFSFNKQLFRTQGQNILDNKHLIRIQDDSLVVWNRSMKKVVSYDVSQLAGSHFTPISTVVTTVYVIALIILAIALIIIIVVWYWRGGPKETSTAFSIMPRDNETPPLVKALLSHKNRHVVADQLDEILGIQNIASPDTLRYKRAQLIKELNEDYTKSKGYKLIHRIPDPNDGRKYVYQIKE